MGKTQCESVVVVTAAIGVRIIQSKYGQHVAQVSSVGGTMTDVTHEEELNPLKFANAGPTDEDLEEEDDEDAEDDDDENEGDDEEDLDEDDEDPEDVEE